MKKIKLILAILALILIYSCVRPVLNKNEYTVIDTLKVNYSNFGRVVGADVIIKCENTYHFGVLNENGLLLEMNVKNLKIDRFK